MTSISALRWLGLLLGSGVLCYVFARFRQARRTRSDFALGALFGLALIVVSAFPSSVNLLRDMLMLERDQFSRLIAVLIASNVGLWLLVFWTRSRAYDREDQFDRLVRSLGLAEFRQRYGEDLALPSLVIVIPAFDEAENVGDVLDAIPDRIGDAEVCALVIDDGSGDGTSDVARRHGARVVRTPVRRGGGAALRLGFDIAVAHGAGIVVTMDADGQHLPREIAPLVAPLLADEADFVIGSRILGRQETDEPLRHFGIHFFNLAIRLLTPVRITDCSNGFRALRVSQLARVLLRQDQFHTAELIIDASKKGIRIAEAPVTVLPRASGISKKGRDWSYGLGFARTVMKTWWR